jgi:23S rRNA (adenine2503-C2)-methyltransferase
MTPLVPSPPHLPLQEQEANKVFIKNLSSKELVKLISERLPEDTTKPERRAQQIHTWVYRKRIRNLDEADGCDSSFSNSFKNSFNTFASLSGQISLQDVHEASDGTIKMVFSLDTDPSKTIETVLIPMAGSKGEGTSRYTCCISSQVGCAMNCQFCATGRLGLMANLSAAQIVEQVIEARRYLSEQGIKEQIQNIVYMGMGEPFSNFDAVMASVDIIAEQLEISRTKILVSTVGLLPQMKQFVSLNKAKLALSLHATTDEVRDWIIPVANGKWKINELVSFLEEAFPMSEARGDRFIVIEYLLLKGVNDTPEDAHRLLSLLKNVYVMVNLIVFNPHEGASQFERSREEDVRRFKSILSKGGKLATIRLSKGDDQSAACGQLGAKSKAMTTPPPILPRPEAFR